MGVAVLTTYCHNQVICPAVGVQIFEHSASNETSLEFSAHKKQSVGLFPPWSVCFLSAVSCVLRELTDWSGCVGPQSAGYAGPARGSLSRMPVLSTGPSTAAFTTSLVRLFSCLIQAFFWWPATLELQQCYSVNCSEDRIARKALNCESKRNIYFTA